MSNVTSFAPRGLSRAHLNIETEFAMLVALRERTSARLDELTGILRAAYDLPLSPLQRMRTEDAAAAVSLPVVALPASGLAQVAAGVLLFKRVRDA